MVSKISLGKNVMNMLECLCFSYFFCTLACWNFRGVVYKITLNLRMKGAALSYLFTGQTCSLGNVKHSVRLLWMIVNEVDERFISYVF